MPSAGTTPDEIPRFQVIWKRFTLIPSGNATRIARINSNEQNEDERTRQLKAKERIRRSLVHWIIFLLQIVRVQTRRILNCMTQVEEIKRKCKIIEIFLAVWAQTKWNTHQRSLTNSSLVNSTCECSGPYNYISFAPFVAHSADWLSFAQFLRQLLLLFALNAEQLQFGPGAERARASTR